MWEGQTSQLEGQNPSLKGQQPSLEGQNVCQNSLIEGQTALLEIGNGSDENQVELIREDGLDSRCGNALMDAPSGEEGDDNEQPQRKRYHRHNQLQILEMEAFFKECPHPDDMQRKVLACRLGLEPSQVKFWFQNKRTQMKAHRDRYVSSQLRSENEQLRAANMRYKEALGNAICLNCGGLAALGERSTGEQQLRLENSRLRDEINRISAMVAKNVGKRMLPFPNLPLGAPTPLDLVEGDILPQPTMPGELFGSTDLLGSLSVPNDAEDTMIMSWLSQNWRN